MCKYDTLYSYCLILVGEDDEHEEPVASKPVYAQPQETQRNHAGGEDSEIPIGEPTESSTSEINKAMFVITVANTHFKPYGSMDLQLPIDEIKFLEGSTTSLSQVYMIVGKYIY